MPNSHEISAILMNSPSVELLRLRNREMIIDFLLTTFSNQQRIISSETIHNRLSDYLEDRQLESDEETEIEAVDSYDIKAKKYIQAWTNKGFLTNYQDEQGEIFYELSSHSNKTLDWLGSLKKEEYVGTDSKFKNIFSQLKELVEFTNDDAATRVELLEQKKKEIEFQIQQIRRGEEVKVFEEYEIIPRFNQLNQAAKELLSDFKEVEDNFKEITKRIYQKHAEGNQTKSDILAFSFEALDELKDSQQGKSFYAFWSFLLNPGLQDEWKRLTLELYETLENKGIPVQDIFLKSMKNHLHLTGQKVYKANDKMAEKLSRIIQENETSNSEITKSVIQEIKKSLIEISKTDQKPDFSLELETDITIHIPFERKLTYDLRREGSYDSQPQLAQEDIINSDQLERLFSQKIVDKDLLRKRIRDLLREQSQATLQEVIDRNGGLEKGLPELFGYLGILKQFKHSISPDKTQRITFDQEQHKSIQIPEIILTK